jgi:hypothetical protein
MFQYDNMVLLTTHKAELMKTLNNFFGNGLNYLRMLMVLTYVLSAMFFIMALADVLFTLSPSVVTIQFTGGFYSGESVSFGYCLYYFMFSSVMYSVNTTVTTKLDSIEADNIGMSKIVILD